MRVGGGVDEVGRVTHTDDASSDFYPSITRSFVTNGSLFTVSEAGIEWENLTTLAEQGWLAF